MARNVDKPIQVTSRPSSLARTPEPVSWIYAGGRYQVQKILETWEEEGRWWEQEPRATAWRVEVQHLGVMEILMLHSTPPTWRLMRIYD